VSFYSSLPAPFFRALGRLHYQVYSGRGSRCLHEIKLPFADFPGTVGEIGYGDKDFTVSNVLARFSTHRIKVIETMESLMRLKFCYGPIVAMRCRLGQGRAGFGLEVAEAFVGGKVAGDAAAGQFQEILDVDHVDLYSSVSTRAG